jgi:hypothetical protein
VKEKNNQSKKNENLEKALRENLRRRKNIDKKLPKKDSAKTEFVSNSVKN